MGPRNRGSKGQVGSAQASGAESNGTALDAESLVQPALGRGLRRLRRRRGLTLEEAASATGLEPSFLDEVERGSSDITIGRLMAIMAVYQAHMEDLVTRSSDGLDPAGKLDGHRHIRSERGVDLYLLTPDTNRAMMPVMTTFAPFSRLANLHPHDGETFIHVLEGRLLLELEGHDPIVLEPGDSAYYRPNPAPILTNVGGGEVRVLGVVTPPTL